MSSSETRRPSLMFRMTTQARSLNAAEGVPVGSSVCQFAGYWTVNPNLGFRKVIHSETGVLASDGGNVGRKDVGKVFGEGSSIALVGTEVEVEKAMGY